MEGHKNGAIRGMSFERSIDNIDCKICIQGKMTRALFSKSSKKKSELFEIIHSDICRPMRVLQSNNGTEYRNKAFDKFLRIHGIGRRLTITHISEQNGIAERQNRTLVESECLLMQSNPDHFGLKPLIRPITLEIDARQTAWMA